MLGKFFASSALRQTQSIIMSVYDQQKEEIDIQYKYKNTYMFETWSLQGWRYLLSTRCYQNFVIWHFMYFVWHFMHVNLLF